MRIITEPFKELAERVGSTELKLKNTGMRWQIDDKNISTFFTFSSMSNKLPLSFDNDPIRLKINSVIKTLNQQKDIRQSCFFPTTEVWQLLHTLFLQNCLDYFWIIFVYLLLYYYCDCWRTASMQTSIEFYFFWFIVSKRTSFDS